MPGMVAGDAPAFADKDKGRTIMGVLALAFDEFGREVTQACGAGTPLGYRALYPGGVVERHGQAQAYELAEIQTVGRFHANPVAGDLSDDPGERPAGFVPAQGYNHDRRPENGIGRRGLVSGGRGGGRADKRLELAKCDLGKFLGKLGSTNIRVHKVYIERCSRRVNNRNPMTSRDEGEIFTDLSHAPALSKRAFCEAICV